MRNFLNLSLTSWQKLKQQLKTEVAEALKMNLKRSELESTVLVLQQHAKVCQKQITRLQ